MSKQKARKGELTGTYAVFFAATKRGTKAEYVALARVGKLLEGSLCSYEFEVMLAFSNRGGELVLEPEDLEAANEPFGVLCDGLNIIGTHSTFTDAFIYAHGLLSEGNRWRAAS